MHCERCHGLIVTETITDMDGTTIRVDAWRCLVCDNIEDAQISQHQRMQRNGHRTAHEHRAFCVNGISFICRFVLQT